jgi:hypothetical protein
MLGLVCAHCGAALHKSASAVNRAARINANLYCDRKCAGMARRRKVQLTDAERKEAKRLYDAQRRAQKHAELCAKKRAHYAANRERLKAEHTEYRNRPENIARHNAYCRRPEYVAEKREYDRKRRAVKRFGEDFGDAFLVLQDLEREIDARASRYDIYMANGTLNKAQLRKRAIQ